MATDASDIAMTSPGRGVEMRILDAAENLFRREGIHATGVERIAEEAQVSKRTLYRHFPSKNDLVEQYLRRINDTGGIRNEQALDTPGAIARNRLLAIFDGPPVNRFRGCPFHNAAVEAADEMPGVHDIVHEHKLRFIAPDRRGGGSRRRRSLPVGPSTGRALRGCAGVGHLAQRHRGHDPRAISGRNPHRRGLTTSRKIYIGFWRR